jgi:hypothetical protein
MPKSSLTTTVTTAITVKSTVRTMLKTRLDEVAKMKAQAKELDAAIKRRTGEIEELLTKAGHDNALNNGVEFEGYKLKRVGGETSTLDKKELMKVFDLSPEELDAFYVKKPKKSYVKITAPGAEGEEE